MMLYTPATYLSVHDVQVKDRDSEVTCIHNDPRIQAVIPVEKTEILTQRWGEEQSQ